MRKSLWVALALLAALASPRVSYAREIDYLQSLTNGFETLKGESVNEEVTPEKDFNDEYKPQEVQLYEGNDSLRALPENPTTTDYVNSTVDTFNTFWWDGQGRITLFRGLQLFTGGSGATNTQAAWLIPAVGLVFVWWGVRKSKNIIMHAFRTGRLNLGTSVKRAWYRRKAKEWYG